MKGALYLREHIPPGCVCMYERQPDGYWVCVAASQWCEVHFRSCPLCHGTGRTRVAPSPP
ncbi:MAG: hypothetical protein ACLPN6_27425 [Streptosporangiaceae bacterium]|jgi:hypothetical protein